MATTARVRLANGLYLDDTVVGRDILHSSAADVALPQPGYISGQLYGVMSTATSSSFTGSANNLYFCLLSIGRPGTFTAINFYTLLAVAAHTGLYSNNEGVPGYLIAGSDVTTATTAIAGENSAAFPSALTLPAGYYWGAILINGSSGITAVGASNPTPPLGIAAVPASGTNLGVRISASQTYGALPNAAPAITKTEASTMPYLPLKAQ